MTTQTLTLEEQERAAYMAGDTRTAELLQQIEDHEATALEVDAWHDEFGTRKQIEADLTELHHLREFFRDCFECLDGHYPCPSVTSDHDKQVIFDAVARGSIEINKDREG